jgi:hypothetical protein
MKQRVFRHAIETASDLIEVVQCLVQVGHHSSRRFVGDLNGGLEYALRYNVSVACRGWFSTDEDTVTWTALECELFEFLLKSGQPTGDQVYVLNERETRKHALFGGLKRSKLQQILNILCFVQASD